MSSNDFLFYTLASLTALCAIAVVVTQNIVRAAAWLLFALAGTAGIFFLLGSNFVGATQLLVYVGGTLVLVVFGVMLTAQGPMVNLKIGPAEWLIAMTAGLLLYAVLAISLVSFKSPVERVPVKAEPPSKIDKELAPSVQLAESLLGLKEATPKEKLTSIGVKVKKVDTENGNMTVTAHGRDQTLEVASDARISLGQVKELKDIKPGTSVILITTTTNVVKEIKPVRERTPAAYILPFEVVSVHLLVVLIGAAYLARAKRRRTPGAGLAPASLLSRGIP